MQRIKKIPFKFWFLLFSVVVLVSTVMRLPGASADEAMIERYSRDKVGLDQAILRYHNDMNTMFNDHIDKLFTLTPNGGRYTVAPPSDKNCSNSKNISTFCLSVRAVETHDAFIQALNSHRGFLKDKEDDSRQTLSQLTGQLDRRLDKINDQILLAEKVMSTTIASYDQLQVFYPLHIQYNDLIGSLEKYRDGLADVRKEVEKYPGTFHNVTTTDCT
jgi:hypothetical protein